MSPLTPNFVDLSGIGAILQSAVEASHGLSGRRQAQTARRRELYTTFQSAASDAIVQAHYLRTLLDTASTSQIRSVGIIVIRSAESWLVKTDLMPTSMAAMIATATDHAFASEGVRLNNAHTDVRDTFRALQRLVESTRNLREGSEKPRTAAVELVNEICNAYGSLGGLQPMYTRLPGLGRAWADKVNQFDRAVGACWAGIDAFSESAHADLARRWWHPLVRRPPQG